MLYGHSVVFADSRRITQSCCPKLSENLPGPGIAVLDSFEEAGESLMLVFLEWYVHFPGVWRLMPSDQFAP